jgi:hypothetical protein
MATVPNYSQPAIFSEVAAPTVPDSGYLKVYANSGVLASIANGGSEKRYVAISDSGLPIGAYTLPTTDGTSSQVLQTNGSGTVTWQTVSGGGGITSINGNTTAAQLLTVGTAGTNFAIDSTTTPGTSVFNIPDASATARGLVTTGTQTIAGAKTFTGNTVFSQVVSTSGSPIGLTFNGAAHTTLTASTEAADVNFNLARTVQFATGAITTQRAMRIQAPTYSFVGASTITTASTLSISGAPAAGTNATITNSHALLIDNPSNSGSVVRINASSAGVRPTQYSVFNASAACVSYLDSSALNGAFYIVSVGEFWAKFIAGLDSGDPYIGFGSGSSAVDLILRRDDANIFAQRNSTNAQQSRIYTTYTSATSYERLNFKGKASANFEIGPENGSAGGTLRGLTIGGYSAGSTTITPWLTFTNAGAATFSAALTCAAITSSGAFSTTSTITATGNITTEGLISSDRYGVSANYRLRRANGTSASPSQVTSGQAVGALSSFGYHDTAAFHTSAGAIIYFVAAENFTSTAHGTNIQLWTTPTTSTTSVKRVCIEASGEVTLEAGSHLQTSGAGFKIGTATSQKIGFWNATPVVQQTTASTSATVVGGGGTTVTQTDTFDGYTLAQIVKALRTIGILA